MNPENDLDNSEFNKKIISFLFKVENRTQSDTEAVEYLTVKVYIKEKIRTVAMIQFPLQVLVLSVVAVSSVIALKGYDDQFVTFNVKANICVGNYCAKCFVIQAYNPLKHAFKKQTKTRITRVFVDIMLLQ
ncbi:UNVERIFIED_CONTAM: hypothetical protein NCL1_46100 [Trichonephila clavipes]